MKIYWSIHSIPELASLALSERNKAWWLACKDLLKNRKEKLGLFLFIFVAMGMALGVLRVLRRIGFEFGSVDSLTYGLVVGCLIAVVLRHYLVARLRPNLSSFVKNRQSKGEG